MKAPVINEFECMKLLPLPIGFSLAYLDGALEGELPEVARHWQTVRFHMLQSAKDAAEEAPTLTASAKAYTAMANIAARSLSTEMDGLAQANAMVAAYDEIIKLAREMIHTPTRAA